MLVVIFRLFLFPFLFFFFFSCCATSATTALTEACGGRNATLLHTCLLRKELKCWNVLLYVAIFFYSTQNSVFFRACKVYFLNLPHIHVIRCQILSATQRVHLWNALNPALHLLASAVNFSMLLIVFAFTNFLLLRKCKKFDSLYKVLLHIDGRVEIFCFHFGSVIHTLKFKFTCIYVCMKLCPSPSERTFAWNFIDISLVWAQVFVEQCRQCGVLYYSSLSPIVTFFMRK